MTESAPSPLSTFVLRFWRERTAAGGGWRGRIEHLESGEGIAFVNWQQMAAFVRRFGIMPEIGEGGPCTPQLRRA